MEDKMNAINKQLEKIKLKKMLIQQEREKSIEKQNKSRKEIRGRNNSNLILPGRKNSSKQESMFITLQNSPKTCTNKLDDDQNHFMTRPESLAFGKNFNERTQTEHD